MTMIDGKSVIPEEDESSPNATEFQSHLKNVIRYNPSLSSSSDSSSSSSDTSEKEPDVAKPTKRPTVMTSSTAKRSMLLEKETNYFDGLMHLNSLDIQEKMKTKMFAFNKAPFVQVLSGLKD